MALYVGEGIAFAVVVTDPLTEEAIIDNSVTVTLDLYSPPKNPSTTPADRTPDDGPHTMSFDADVVNTDGTSGAWVVTVDSTGFDAGKWWYKVNITGAYSAWSYGSFKLVA